MNRQRQAQNPETLAPGIFLGVALVASVWQLWTFPMLFAVSLLLLLAQTGSRPTVVSLAFLSMAGAVFPLSSLAQGRDVDHLYGLVLYLLLGWVGLLLGFRSGSKPIVLGITVFVLVLILFTLLAVLVDPVGSFNQTDYHQGALTGPFGHRNTMGAFLAFGLVPLLLVRTRTRIADIARWGLVGVVATLIVATESLSPVVALVISVLFAHALSGFLGVEMKRLASRPRASWLFAALIGTATAAVFLVVVAPLWRPSLGSRFDIWSLALERLIASYPSPPGVEWLSSPEILDTLGFYPWHSHNALIQLFLIYGILPTLLFLVAGLGAVLGSASLDVPLGGVDDEGVLVATALLGYITVHGVVETTFISGPVGILVLGLVLGVLISRGAPGRGFTGPSTNPTLVVQPNRVGWRRLPSDEGS